MRTSLMLCSVHPSSALTYPVETSNVRRERSVLLHQLLFLLLAVAEGTAHAAQSPIADPVQDAAEHQRDVAEDGQGEAHIQLALAVWFV